MLKTKRIYLNLKKTKYCIAKLYSSKEEMANAYKKFRPLDKNHNAVLGCHCAYEKWNFVTSPKKTVSKKGIIGFKEVIKSKTIKPETGTVFLCFEHCGAGVVTHELMHAIIWAHKHRMYKKQYPFVLNNMKEEEKLLHNFTYAVRQFYDWYWKIEKEFEHAN